MCFSEYREGCNWEIYSIILPPIFCNRLFADVAYDIYKDLGVILFGLKITSKDRLFTKIFLNPGKKMIPSSDFFEIGGFVVAQDQGDSVLGQRKQRGGKVLAHQMVRTILARSSSGGGAAVSPATSGKTTAAGSKSKNVLSTSGNIQNRLDDIKFRHSLEQYDPFSLALTPDATVEDDGIQDAPKRLVMKYKHELSVVNENTELQRSDPGNSYVAVEPTAAHSAAAGGGSAAGSEVASSENRSTSSSMDQGDPLGRSMLAIPLDYMQKQAVLREELESHVRRNYFVRSTFNSYEDAQIRTSVIDQYPTIENHIIIIIKDMSALHLVIAPLRSSSAGLQQRIVVLHSGVMPHDVWLRVAKYRAISVVQASIVNEANLVRAGIFRAGKVLVLSSGLSCWDDNGREASGTSILSRSLSDSEAVFTYSMIKRMNPFVQLVVEFMYPENISTYLDPVGCARMEGDYRFSRMYVAGEILNSSIYDTLVCQVNHVVYAHHVPVYVAVSVYKILKFCTCFNT